MQKGPGEVRWSGEEEMDSGMPDIWERGIYKQMR
jgi:hypothetical protein